MAINQEWADAFNRWMDDYTNDPDSFDEIERVALRHLREKLAGKEPSYGERCAAVFAEYMGVE